MKKYILTIIPILCYAASAISQSITPIVVSSPDNFVTHLTFSVSSTLGDFMAQTFTWIQTTNNSNTQLYSVEKGEAAISVFPNPSFGTFYVNIAGSKNNETLIVVRDLLGKEYYSKVVISSSDKEVIAVNPENQLAPGIYFMIITSADNVIAKKIIINK